MTSDLGQCGYVDRPGEPDAEACPEPATQLVVDQTTGIQTVWCDEHAPDQGGD